MLHIAENIRLIRDLTGLSQSDFAEKIGLEVNKDMIYSYESGKAKPKSVIIDKIAEIAEISKEDLQNKKLTVKDFHADRVKGRFTGKYYLYQGKRKIENEDSPDPIEERLKDKDKLIAALEREIELLRKQSQPNSGDLLKTLRDIKETLNGLPAKVVEDLKLGNSFGIVYKKGHKKDSTSG